ncbi:MAG: hypothetical protein KGJ78_03270 [Alphaproteobacteria bacterium]|nr:hypothetical protein [Alphaproteobacteria bacterium]
MLAAFVALCGGASAETDKHFTYIDRFKNGMVAVCLFNQAKVLIRTKACQHN